MHFSKNHSGGDGGRGGGQEFNPPAGRLGLKESNALKLQLR